MLVLTMCCIDEVILLTLKISYCFSHILHLPSTRDEKKADACQQAVFCRQLNAQTTTNIYYFSNVKRKQFH